MNDKEGMCSRTSPDRGKSLQSAVYDVFKLLDSSQDISRELTQKIVTTVGEDLANYIRVNSRWFSQLSSILEECKPHMKMCLWKTLAGAWTTSWRMHESHKFGCLFGCKEEHDDIRHYIVCAPLWHLTGEVLGSPPPVSLAERMCIDKPSVQGVLRLAVVFRLITTQNLWFLGIRRKLMYRTLAPYNVQLLKVLALFCVT